jgi:transposase
VSAQLDVEPARFFVHRHIRPQYACRACETVAGGAGAARRDRRRPGSASSAGLVAVSKFADLLAPVSA